MRVPGNLELHGQLTPTGESLKSFLKMLQKLWQQMASTINGHVAFGITTGLVPGTPMSCDNLDGVFVLTANPVLANVDILLTHNLGRVPVGYFVIKQIPAVANTPGIVFDGSVAASSTQITLRFSAAGQYWLVIV